MPATMASEIDQAATASDVEGLPGPVEILPGERRHLLEVARLAVGVAARVIPESALAGALKRRPHGEPCAGAFVTLTEAGELRGCMGNLDPSRPVTESVVAAATSAALWDPRFARLRAEELPAIEVEVSVLGPLVPLEDPERFRLGIDGLVVDRGTCRGLLLPEVATTHHLGRVEMLGMTCRKAGLPPWAWRAPGTVVSAFRTAHFGGPAAEATR